MATSSTAAAAEKTILGHPRGLAVLFLTEMWERFSFYGMRALLVLYLTQHFLFGDREAQGLYAAYASLVYLAPVLGGFVADRWLGSRKAVTIGALLLVAGHFGMAFEGSGSKQYVDFGGKSYELVAEGRGEDRRLTLLANGVALPATFSASGLAIDNGASAGLPAAIPTADLVTRTEQQPIYVQILFFSLSLIIVGVGFLKANISTIVGALYAQGDPRRDGGFTIFYMGINLGSVLSTALCGWLGISYGWKYGFGLAGFGMLFGLLTFLWGQKWLGGHAEPPVPARLKDKAVGPLNIEWLIYVLGFIMLLPAWFLVQRDAIVIGVLSYGAPLILLGMLGWSLFALKGVERSRMVVALVLITFSVLFWTLFEQAGSSLTLYADRNTNLAFMNAAQVQLFNPFFIVTLAPLFAALWTWLGRKGLEPSTPIKFALALAQVGLGFLVLVIGIDHFADSSYRVPLMWLALAYLLHTTGEICLSPVGLSMITKLSVPRVVGLMMGVWFLASALAHTLAGLVAQATSSATVGGVVVDPAAQLATYREVFSDIGWAGVAVGAVLLVISPFLKRGMAMDVVEADHALAGEREIGEAGAIGMPASPGAVHKEQL